MSDRHTSLPSRVDGRLARAVVAALALATALPAAAGAQPPGAADTRPVFSLSAGEIASSKRAAEVTLLFRRVPHLDFRIYRVNDPLAFFAKLRDPHRLGSDEPIVPEEQTPIERVAAWKAAMRDRVRSFIRRQFSYDYRAGRHQRRAVVAVARRQTLRYNTFAQAPLLNPSQLVASWREVLPNVRDTEVRRIPLETRGPGVYVVEAVFPPHRAYTVAVVSDIGLVTKAAPGQLVVFAANRFDGRPVAGCDVEAVAGGQVRGAGTTAGDGVWEHRIERLGDDEVVAVARCGTEVAVTDPGAYALRESSRDLVGYIYTDKPIYRPGHTVNVKAFLRWRTRGQLAPFDRRDVEVVVLDGNEKVLLRQRRPVNEFGGVDASLALSPHASLGYYTIQINSDDQEATETFEVQEYRKPEYEVIVSPAERFVRQGEPARLAVSARYYFGQPVAGGEVKYAIRRTSYYSPLRWSGEAPEEDSPGRSWFGGDETVQGTATLGPDGRAEIALPLQVDEKGRDYSARIEARVIDASSREVSGTTVVHATFGQFLVAASLDRFLYRPGTAAAASFRVVGYQGQPQPGRRLTITIDRVSYPHGRWEDPSYTVVSETSAKTDAEGRASVPITVPSAPGDYRVHAGTPDEDRLVYDDAHFWVPGAAAVETDEEDWPYAYLELASDKGSYQPGETARLSIRGATRDGFVLVTKESQDVSWRRVAMVRSAEAIEVPIEETDMGDVFVNVAYLQADRLFQAEKRVKVPATRRQLRVEVAADTPVSRPTRPGLFSVSVTDHAGRPVAAELSVGVVDEAVYGVKPDDTPDPLRFFYRREWSRVNTQFSRQYWFVGHSGREQLLLTQRRRPMALADFKGEPPQPQVRKEFPDRIHWLANLRTDAAGKARVEVTYPDSLTTWRITVRGLTADTLVGAAVARTTTTKDLIARVVAPRFLTEGDEAEIPVIAHNYLPTAKTVAVSMTAAGVTTTASPAPAGGALSVVVAQGGEARFDWRVTAERPGTATFTGSASTEVDRDAVEIALPVLPFGLKRQTGSSGTVAGNGEQALTLTVPATANPSARTIRVALAPSLAGSLLGALDMLTSYPYGCTEQTLSSFVPNLVVTRALAELKIAPTERLQALDRQVTDGLTRLYEYQHDDGGWGWWKADVSSPFMTAYALYGLIEAERAGYRVESWRTRRAIRAVAVHYRTWPRAVPDLKAYLVNVLAQAESGDAPDDRPADDQRLDIKRELDELWSARDRMTHYGRALLLQTLNLRKDARVADLSRELLAAATTRGELAWWTVESDPLLDDYGDSSVDATAQAVRALAAGSPGNPLVEKAVRWLLLNRNFGSYWSNTKQTAMVLYGLLDFVRARNEGAADFVVDVVVNGAPAGTRAFTPASLVSPDPVVIEVPAREGANDIRIVKRGGGTLYWTAQADYVDRIGASSPTGSRKLGIGREYFLLTPVQKAGRIVYRETPISGPVNPGDLVLARLTVAGAADWRHLAVEDPIPAGTEAVPRWSLYELERRDRPNWFWDGSRREYRDDRVVLFLERLQGGRADFVYLLKVTTPGIFRARPAQVAPMYVPGTSASSDALTLMVGAPSPASGGAVR